MTNAGHTQANQMLRSLQSLTGPSLDQVLTTAQEYSDSDEVRGKVMPAGTRLMSQLVLAYREVIGVDPISQERVYQES